MTHEIEIIGRDGTRRTERNGYAVRDGERIASVRVPMTMMDNNSGSGRIIIHDADDTQQLRDAGIAARDAMIERQSNAWKGDDRQAASLPAGIYDALPIKHRSTLPRAIGAVNDAKASGDTIALRHAIDDLRRLNSSLAPMPGLHSLTADASSAIEQARQWCDALCDSASTR